MSNFKIVFESKDSSTNHLTIFKSSRELIGVDISHIKMGEEVKSTCGFLDKQSAVKLSKELKRQLSLIEE